MRAEEGRGEARIHFLPSEKTFPCLRQTNMNHCPFGHLIAAGGRSLPVNTNHRHFDTNNTTSEIFVPLDFEILQTNRDF